MKVDWTKKIGGVRMVTVRDTLRAMGAGRHSGYVWSRSMIANKASVDIAEELVAEGLLTRRPAGDYEITDAAMRFGNTKKRKPIDRAEAEAIVDALLVRADAVNANDQLAARVRSIRAFGSYITDAPELNDIDVAFYLERKNREPDRSYSQINAARVAVAKAAGRSVSYEYSWGEREVALLLKGKEHYLSPTSATSLDEMIEETGCPFRTIYPRS